MENSYDSHVCQVSQHNKPERAAADIWYLAHTVRVTL